MDQGRPRLAVVMPTYNQADHLRDAVASVFKQEPCGLEVHLVIVNDGSTDGTDEILGKYGSGNTWVLPSRPEGNQGTFDAINRGHEFAIERLDPTIMAWVSSDNVMLPHWLKVLVDLMAEKELDFAYGAFTLNCGKMTTVGWIPARGPATKVGFCEYTPDNFGWGPAAIYTRELWDLTGKHNPGYAHDLDWWIRAEKESGYRGGSTLEVLCEYRVHDNRSSARAVAEKLVRDRKELMDGRPRAEPKKKPGPRS